ncbi:MAG: KpsF/GutQ family sugar-phosphate isomerase [Pseudomonadota bacterium]|jgi:arabinose-5-phosphate isomerase|uniref:Arabinose 5-phosphate isomerase n=1 Tax=Marisediminitalea aggregata TaxID=634436 RepID=A0A1M5HM91_9ALTE|nr:KpsF/GutQ family sugar-phosphate isomerase [Marisediminitalea aggregata]MAP19334.1 KpsF/GutQ family sugar-phosphate isomerase [Alteromonadaceae bacterium]MEC7824252.1 KpsF/GutQ family sugar-phosphate isomerase [Pseudomonadota bacterium]MCP9477978.1 KpsF/GutQ family sugar-phosphate isomerase [Marisediminitalea aggregata]MEC8228841.1 KpsF/GutQ family sugar-phosphate isomerase [Pseudomonadota bacterium]SHG17055.1 arabinose-5-phosphate isomerase [Marisediminitalea aggregata]|tara:strand:+ start:25353 stop:26330 length:978 start_codon:yes stop_codon:yes gene_type:complete
MTTTNAQFIASGKQVVDIELNAIAALSSKLDEHFANACNLLMQCNGKVVVSGMGKSGHIGNKIAATLASTGTPAFFMHPGEANHGDLGMLAPNDVLVAISNSGETGELLNLLPVVKRMNVPVIAITNRADSTLGKHADVVLDIGVEQEACSLGLAPTTSTTVTLVLGDALAVALLDAKGFTSDDFALSHPGGSLGRKLLLTVDDIMLKGDEIPLVSAEATITQALLEISKKGLGLTGIVDDNRSLLGVFTDGDLRRLLDARVDIHTTRVAEVMTTGCKTSQAGELAVEALNLMENYKISALLVVNEHKQPIGAFNMHMLLKAGVI